MVDYKPHRGRHIFYRNEEGYEVLGKIMPSEVSVKSRKDKKRSMKKSGSGVCGSNDSVKLDYCQLQPSTNNTYIGGMTQVEAETTLTSNISFVVYHKIPRVNCFNDLKMHIHLYMAFKDGEGQCHHFKIKNRANPDAKNKESFYLKGPYPASPNFDSIDKLIRFYRRRTVKVSDQFIGQSSSIRG
uniref:SH2 domain-containing protein n=1 Tax=Rhabditophanes sp. KR3021 TaxID=114890 RepID=A0AC35UI50_9BILA